MKWIVSCLIFIVPVFSFAANNLLAERQGHKTVIVSNGVKTSKYPKPNVDFVKLIKYPAKTGKLNAYIAKPAKVKGLSPALIWLTGGFPTGGAGKSVWTDRGIDNDQSAKQFWQAGFVVMYPSFRGSYGNPGLQQGFWGEVNDVISAYNYLRKQKGVDPKQIYLGGHSTGGTLALLVAASTNKFAGVISYGPASSPMNYGAERQLHDPAIKDENYFRAPLNFLHYIDTPTIIIEGETGRSQDLRVLKVMSKNDDIKTFELKRADHFSPLAPLNQYLASYLKQHKELDLERLKLQEEYDQFIRKDRDLNLLNDLVKYRQQGFIFDKRLEVVYPLLSRSKTKFKGLKFALMDEGFEVSDVTSKKDNKGKPFYEIQAIKFTTLGKLTQLQKNIASIETLSQKFDLHYQGWHPQYVK